MGPIINRRPASLYFHSLLMAAFFALAASPKTAQAHLVTSGAGPFFDGVAHFFVSLDALLVVVALSLLSGLLGKTAARGLVLVLPLAWLVGMVLGLSLAGRIDGIAWYRDCRRYCRPRAECDGGICPAGMAENCASRHRQLGRCVRVACTRLALSGQRVNRWGGPQVTKNPLKVAGTNGTVVIISYFRRSVYAFRL